MAFNINAAVVLSGPKNIQKVSSNIKKQLSGINVPVKIQLDRNTARGIKTVNSQLKGLNTTLSTLQKNAASTASSFNSLANSTRTIQGAATKVNSATNSVNKSLASTAKSATLAGNALQDFGKDAALAVRRFAAFSAATGVVFGFTRAVTTATKEAIQFQRELAKITQVTGQAGKNLDGLRRTIDNLSTGLGLGANELLGVARTFAQTGQSIDQVRKSLAAVSKASLAPTFGDIQKTTEGAIAALSQFKLEANALEGVLGSLNQVSKRFAVESDDLISVIRRAGGVFAASSQQLGAPEERLRELIGIFTAVRSTTRESADTIATGLRTIFTRIQRPQTIEFLKQFGVQLRATKADAQALGVAEGDFIGIFEALKRISKASKGLDTLQTARLVEELGGVRQVGKLIPALQNFEKAEKAVQVALKGRGSIAKDVGIATQTLSVQIEQLQQRFGKLIRDIADSSTFQNLAKFAIQTANAFITLADALRPILPALTAIAAVKIGAATFDIARGFVGGIKKGGGAAGIGAGVANLATGGGASQAQQTATQKQASAAASKNTTALNSNTSALKTLNTSISNLQRSSQTLNTSAGKLTTQASTLNATLARLPAQIAASTRGGGAIPIGRRRAAGGKIPKFKKGGFVQGASHAQGGVVAELEGGELVVPKKQAQKLAIGGITKAAATRAASGRSLGKTDDLFNVVNGKPEINKAFGSFLGPTREIPGTGGKTNRFGNLPPEVQKRLVKEFRQSQSGKGKGSGAAATARGSRADAVDVFNTTNAGQFGIFVVTGSSKTTGKLPKGLKTTGTGSSALKGKFPNSANAASLNIAGGSLGFNILKIGSKSSTERDMREDFSKAADIGLSSAIEAIYNSSFAEGVGVPPFSLKDRKNFKIDKAFDEQKGAFEGVLLESVIRAVGDISIPEKGAGFDFPNLEDNQRKNLAKIFEPNAPIETVVQGEAKRSTAAINDGDNRFSNKIARSTVAKLVKVDPETAAQGKLIGGRGMSPVRVSNGEGLISPDVAKGNLADLERARKGNAEAISRVSNLPISKIKGPGTGTSDSISGSVAAGSFVLPARSMKKMREQRLNVGGIVKGIGSAIKKDPTTALFLGLEGSLLATSESAEELKSNLLNAAITLAFFGPQLKEFVENVKEVNASLSKVGKESAEAATSKGTGAAAGRAGGIGGRSASRFLSTATVGEVFAGVKEQLKTLSQAARNSTLGQVASGVKANVKNFRALGKRSKELKATLAALDVEIVAANANFTQQSNLVNKLTAQRNATTSTIDKLFKKQAAYRKAASGTLPVLETQDDFLKAIARRKGLAKFVKDARNVRGNLLEKFFKVRGKRDAAEATAASLLQTPTGSFVEQAGRKLSPVEELTAAIKDIRAGNIEGGKATIQSLGAAGKGLDLQQIEAVRKELATLPKSINKVAGNIKGLNIGLLRIGENFNQTGRLVNFAKGQYKDLGLAIKTGVTGNTIVNLQNSLDGLDGQIAKVSATAIDASQVERGLQIRRANIADDLVNVGAGRKIAAKGAFGGLKGLKGITRSAAGSSIALGKRALGAAASPFTSIGRAFSEGGVRGGAKAIATSPLINPVSGFKAAGTGIRKAISGGFKSATGGITKSFDEGVRNFNKGRATAIKKEAVQAFKEAGGKVTRTGASQLTARGGDKAAREALRQSFAEAGEIAAKGGTRAGARASLAGAANVGAKGLAGGVKLLGGPGGIAAIVASLVGDPIVEGISKAAVGARKEIAGIGGFTADQGGQRQAQLVGGAKGAIQGASLGASIGLATGPLAPILAPILGVLGGVGGAAIGAATAGREQARFESVERAQQSGDRLAEVLDRLAGEGINNIKVLNQVSTASSKLNNQIIRTANDLERLQGAQGIREAGGFGSEFTATLFGAFEGLGAGIGTETTFFGKVEAAFDNLAVATGGLSTVFTSAAAGFAAGSVFGGIGGAISGIANREEAVRTATNRRDARLGAASVLGQRKSLSTSLAAIDDKVFEKAGENFDRLGQTIIDSIPLENLGEIASLGIDASFGDLTAALKEAGDGSEKFAAQLKAFTQLQGTVIAGDLKKLDSRLQAAAGDDQGLQKLFSATTNAGAKFLDAFQKSGGSSEAAEAQAGQEFIKQLNSLRTAQARGRGDTIESLLGGTRDFAELSKLFDDAAEGSAKAEAKLARLANAIQGADEDATSSRQSLQLATDSFRAFTDAASKGAAANIAAAAKQRLVNQILLDSQRQVDALAQALDTLATGIQGAVATFSQTLANVDQEIAGILSTRQSIQGLNRGNIFENVQGASKDELRAGVNRVRAAVGGNAEDFKDIPDTIKLGDALPQALKDTIDGLRKNADKLTFVEFQDALTKRLEQDIDFGNLSDVVKGQFNNLLEATFSGTRQSDKLGAEEFTKLLEQTGGLQEFSEIAVRSVEAFSASLTALNQFENALLKTADLQVQATRQIVDAELKILQKREQINDRFAKFTIGGTGGVAGAKSRTQAEVDTLLNAGGAGPAALAIGGTAPADLLNRRTALEENIKGVLTEIGQKTGIDPTDEKALASLDKSEFQPLLDKLASNTSALEGTKQAIDVLSEDTRTLSAVEGELAAVNSQRLTERQRLQAGLSQLSNAKTPEERNRVLNEIQRPFIAANKLAAGQALTLQEGAALQGDLLQGNTGIVANAFRQQNPGATEDEVSAFLEKSLANFQIGGQNLFRQLGVSGSATDAILGTADGPGATVKGETEKEKGLLDLKDQILAQQEELIKGTAELNANAIRDREELLRGELDATKAKLKETGDAFAELRRKQSELIESTLIAAQQLEGAKAKDEAAQAEKKTADLKATQAANAESIAAAERAEKADSKPRRQTRQALQGVIGDIEAERADRANNRNTLAIDAGRETGLGQEDFFQLFQDRTQLEGSFIGQAVGATNIEKAFGIDDAGFGGSLFNVNASFQNLEQSDVAKRSRQQVLKNIAQTVAGGKLGENEDADRIFENLKSALETAADSGVAQFTEGDKGLQTAKVAGVGDFSKVIERIIVAELRKADEASSAPVKVQTATGETKEFALGSQELKDFQAEQDASIKKAQQEATDANKRLADTKAKIETAKQDAAKKKATTTDVSKPAAQQAAGAAPGTPIGPEEARVKQEIAEENKKLDEAKKKASQIGSDSPVDLPPVISEEDRKKKSAQVEADRKAEQQARIDAARKQDQAAASGPTGNPLLDTKFSATGLENVDPVTLAGGEADFAQQQAKNAALQAGLRAQQQPAAKAAAGNLKAPSDRFAGSGTDFGTLEEIRKGKSFNQFKEAVGPQNAQLFLDEKKDQAADRARQKQIAAEARDPRKRTRRLADLEKEQRAQANRKKLLEEKGGFGEKDAAKLSELKQTVGPLSEDQSRELASLKARQGLSTRIGTGEKRIQALSLGGQTGLRPSDAPPVGAPSDPIPEVVKTEKAKQQVQRQTEQGVPTQAQGKIPNPAGQPADAKSGSGGAQAGGAQTLSDAVNTITSSTFAKDLLSAANKLSELETLNINFEGSIKPIEVILNGGGLLQQLTEGVKQELVPLISSAVQEQLRSIN